VDEDEEEEQEEKEDIDEDGLQRTHMMHPTDPC
jgi:hypothetical protein